MEDGSGDLYCCAQRQNRLGRLESPQPGAVQVVRLGLRNQNPQPVGGIAKPWRDLIGFFKPCWVCENLFNRSGALSVLEHLDLLGARGKLAEKDQPSQAPYPFKFAPHTYGIAQAYYKCWTYRRFGSELVNRSRSWTER